MRESAVIRRAAPDDANAIAEIHVASWRGAYQGLLPQAMLDNQSVERRAEHWRQQVVHPGQITLVADSDGQVVGFAASGPSRDDDAADAAELYAIYVTPDAWSTGAGHALHDATIALLAPEFDEVVLWVLAGNARARTFYERHGWSTDGSTKQDQRDDVILDEVRYRRRLDA